MEGISLATIEFNNLCLISVLAQFKPFSDKLNDDHRDMLSQRGEKKKREIVQKLEMAGKKFFRLDKTC